MTNLPLKRPTSFRTKSRKTRNPSKSVNSRSSTWPSQTIPRRCSICAHIKHALSLTNSTGSIHHPIRNKHPHELNLKISHTKEVRLFCKVMGVDQALTQQIAAIVEETHLAGIRNFRTNSINDTVADIITHLQDSYM